MAAWEIVVGIETHAQLATRSKMFSGAATAFGAPPNTQASAVDIALPGVLPVANAAAVECALRFGLAVGGERPPGWNISRRSVFARKNYFYPDLPKGYQISQYELPIVTGGEVRIMTAAGAEKVVRLTRAHLEEDAGKSLHEDFHGMTGIDLNRAGTPLLEIVSEPELRGAQEAVAYARALHALVRWIGICDGNMQEGSFRCDANVSVRKAGEAQLGTRCEIKNLNSFRFMEQAIEYEARRQIEILEDGGRIAQETRLYDPDKGETRSMRTKEEAHDYRYFPDPDLLPLLVSEAQIERVRAALPELPAQKFEKFTKELLVSSANASVLIGDKALAEFFEAAVKDARADVVKLTENWIVTGTTGKLHEKGIDISRAPISAQQMRGLMERIADGTISGKIAKEVDDAIWAGEGSADEIIERRGLRQISDAGAIERIVDAVLAQNARQVEDYRAGKEKAFNALVGQVMKATQGKANPAQVNAVLKARLGKS
jgi:aspartyl-tRNA(Asn)/glutamyl-tRNA(Gln) amidotransferase subunit B